MNYSVKTSNKETIYNIYIGIMNNKIENKEFDVVNVQYGAINNWFIIKKSDNNSTTINLLKKIVNNRVRVFDYFNDTIDTYMNINQICICPDYNENNIKHTFVYYENDVIVGFDIYQAEKIECCLPIYFKVVKYDNSAILNYKFNSDNDPDYNDYNNTEFLENNIDVVENAILIYNYIEEHINDKVTAFSTKPVEEENKEELSPKRKELFREREARFIKYLDTFFDAKLKAALGETVKEDEDEKVILQKKVKNLYIEFLKILELL